jgi:hypothetical protein
MLLKLLGKKFELYFLYKSIYTKMPNVIEICKTPEYIDQTLLKSLVSAYLAPRIPFYTETGGNMFIEDEFSEYFVAKVSGGVQIGKGHCPMDVKASNGDGIDAMCVCLNGNQTNEKSIIQNFAESGKALDGLFADKKDVEAVTLYMADLKKKWAQVKVDKALGNLYYMCFTSTKANVYFTTFKIDADAIDAVESAGFRAGPTGDKNILFKNFIDPVIGIVTLYKSKKRIELRLTKAILESEHTVKLY